MGWKFMRLLDWSAWGLGFTVERVGAGRWMVDLNLGPLFMTWRRR